MKYKVEFEHDFPIRAIQVRSANRIGNLTDFGEKEGKWMVEFLYVDAENEQDAIKQAQGIVATIFRF